MASGAKLSARIIQLIILAKPLPSDAGENNPRMCLPKRTAIATKTMIIPKIEVSGAEIKETICSKKEGTTPSQSPTVFCIKLSPVGICLGIFTIVCGEVFVIEPQLLAIQSLSGELNKISYKPRTTKNIIAKMDNNANGAPLLIAFKFE